MACKVYRYGHNGVPVDEGHQPGELKEMIFSCDADGCDVKADDDHIAGSGGLRYMGVVGIRGEAFLPDAFRSGR
jgi:hypothetical protein